MYVRLLLDDACFRKCTCDKNDSTDFTFPFTRKYISRVCVHIHDDDDDDDIRLIEMCIHKCMNSNSSTNMRDGKKFLLQLRTLYSVTSHSEALEWH